MGPKKTNPRVPAQSIFRTGLFRGLQTRSYLPPPWVFLPLPCLALLMSFLRCLVDEGDGAVQVLRPVSETLAALTAVLCLGALGWQGLLWRSYLSKRQELKRLRCLHEHCQETRDRALADLTLLRKQVDLLAAGREIAAVANQNSELKEILCEVTKIVGAVMGVTEMAVFLGSETNAQLLACMKQDGVVHTDGSLSAPAGGNVLRDAFRKGTTCHRATMRGHVFGVLLGANKRLIGGLEVLIPSESAPEEMAFNLEILSRAVAIAVSKPTLIDRAMRDGLTELFSKRHFLDLFEAQFKRAIRLKSRLSLLLFDLDHFKRVNDSRGHPTGDKVLKEVAQRIRKAVRSYDIPCRYGGEEIAVICPDVDPQDAIAMAERIRGAIEAQPILCEGQEPIHLTVSGGVSSIVEGFGDPDEMLEVADKRLYHAKKTGRNRVEPSGSTENPVFALVPALAACD